MTNLKELKTVPQPDNIKVQLVASQIINEPKYNNVKIFKINSKRKINVLVEDYRGI